ncbi:MAG: TIGR03790 family protein, partial [Candidatus Eisenbacteria bacterium]|nr:TIGR03790 family protein [Candidatus Eisenbacteria bacterium]
MAPKETPDAWCGGPQARPARRTRTASALLRAPALALAWLVLWPPVPAEALDPSEIVVIANRAVPESVDLARYYMASRRIPPENVIPIRTTTEESIDREAYRREIAGPVLLRLGALSSTATVRCLVLVYGIPLRIRPPAPSEAEEAEIERLRRTLRPLQDYLETHEEAEDRDEVTAAIDELRRQIEQLTGSDTRAAVDSEIALVLKGGYPLEGWLPNPHFPAFREQQTLLRRSEVLMVSRLDGPDPSAVRRMIDDAAAAEQAGLTGRAYFDARWVRPETKQLSGYALYDAAIHHAAELVERRGRMEVTVDDRARLFQEGECPQAALYCGWYRLSQYVDAFEWVPGSVGFHIASGECTTLKKPESQVWCKRM